MKRIDLGNRSIPRALFGYDRTQIDRLMQDLSDALGRVTEEKITLSARVKELESALAEAKEREAALKDALSATSCAGDVIRSAARKEAELILETARLKADRMVQNADARLARLVEEAADAKKTKALFEMKLKAVIDDHLRLLTLNRQESASLEAAARKMGGTAFAATPAPPAKDGA